VTALASFLLLFHIQRQIQKAAKSRRPTQNRTTINVRSKFTRWP